VKLVLAIPLTRYSLIPWVRGAFQTRHPSEIEATFIMCVGPSTEDSTEILIMGSLPPAQACPARAVQYLDFKRVVPSSSVSKRDFRSLWMSHDTA